MEPWLASLAVFVLAALAAQQAQTAFASLARHRTLTRRRFASLLSGGGGARDVDALLRRSSRLGASSWAAALERLLVQSGTGLSLPALAGLVGTLSAALWLVVPLADGPTRLAVALLASAATVLGYLRLRRAKRLARFGEQLPDVIDVVVRSLRAGHPIPVSLALVAREMPDPAGPEFALVVDEISYGRSIAEALGNLHDRVGHPELRFFVAAASIAIQTGGNLGEILSRLARTLRERSRLARRVRSLSAEGRFSGLALSILPIALYGLISIVSPAYYAEFWTIPSAPNIALVALGLLVVGNGLVFRLVRFKV